MVVDSKSVTTNILQDDGQLKHNYWRGEVQDMSVEQPLLINNQLLNLCG